MERWREQIEKQILNFEIQVGVAPALAYQYLAGDSYAAESIRIRGID